MTTTQLETPNGYATSPRGYTELAAQCRVAGSPIAKFFERRAHEATAALESERFTARRVIAETRRNVEAEYESTKQDMDREACRLVVVDGHAVAALMRGLVR